ncbi:hypothetical protein BDV96DRAFT_103979 [Lophiotrema nucula]|uniref:Uncharacterized protein n=1 Tax=Lophiotrema nucula TaxID=690887 RepID=A0A6A5Z5Q9_9PLEO|nr:hypothetical protein BDV96DRAFT_103979 [Lophiotrema nucula]
MATAGLSNSTSPREAHGPSAEPHRMRKRPSASGALKTTRFDIHTQRRPKARVPLKQLIPPPNSSPSPSRACHRRTWRTPALKPERSPPPLMTEATQRSNGARPPSMTAPVATAQENDTDVSNAPKSSPTPKDKDKAATVPASDAPTKTPKKRRKVNHGKGELLCTPNSVNGPANS